MVEYNCLLCSFKTTFTTNYKKHLKSKKHLAKEKEFKNGKESMCTQNAPKMHPNMHLDAPKGADNKTCEFCQKRFTRTTGLKKHLQICSYRNSSKNAPKCTQMLPECYPNVTQMLPADENEENKKNECPFCFKIFSTRHGKSRHLKICKIKKNEIENKNEIKNKNEKIEALLKQNQILIEKNNTLTTNNITNINTQNNGTINYLNINFNNVQPMEKFIENFKTKFQLTEDDRRCLLNTYNECDI